jgi:hypothetical protein
MLINIKKQDNLGGTAFIPYSNTLRRKNESRIDPGPGLYCFAR